MNLTHFCINTFNTNFYYWKRNYKSLYSNYGASARTRGSLNYNTSANQLVVI